MQRLEVSGAVRPLGVKRITGILREDQYKFLITSVSTLLRMRNVSDKICRENQNTHFVFSNFFFRISYLL